jgi:hypothetical protein
MSYNQVTINTYTAFGPFYSGSSLVVSRQYAYQLLNQYGRGVRVTDTSSNVWSVYPSHRPVPNGRPGGRPMPGPMPIPNGRPTGVGVIFFTEVYDPVADQTYDAGPLYRFTVQGLSNLNSRVGGLVFYSDPSRREQIPVSQLGRYVGGTVYVDQSVFTFRG